MKKITYIYRVEYNAGTAETPNLVSIETTCCRYATGNTISAVLNAVKDEAYNGEYTVEDVPDPVTEPTLEERNRSDIDYLSMMTGVDLPAPEV